MQPVHHLRGLRIARQAFDAGTIWDDTEAMPLLYDGFEEQAGQSRYADGFPKINSYR